MSGWWVVCLSVVLVSISSANRRFDLETPVRRARCWAACLYKLNPVPESEAECNNTPYCSQCWKSCEALHTSAFASLLCKGKDCGPGSPNIVSPVPLEEVLVVNDSRVSWPSVSSPVVYVVMAGGSSLCQTLQLSAHLPSTVDLATVRVLVVDWRGLVKVFAPVAESPVDRALHILRSLGMDHSIAQGSHTVSGNDVLSVEDPPTQFRIDSSWRVSLLSLHHQPSLVLAQVGWESYHSHLLSNNHVNISYLVSWTAEGDVVKGNLLTNTSKVTLSLWPDTTYRIQVALFSLESPAIQSEPITLDTHLDHELTTTSRLEVPQIQTDRGATGVSSTREGSVGREVATEESTTTLVLEAPQTHVSRGAARVSTTREGGLGREVAAGVSAAVLVFLGVVLTATWRWRNRLYLPHNKLLDEESDAPNLYRVFPPALRLLGETDPSSDLFSSRDNLLQQHE